LNDVALDQYADQILQAFPQSSKTINEILQMDTPFMITKVETNKVDSINAKAE